MRPVVRRLQRARDVLRRLEGREAPPPSEPLDAALNDPCTRSARILALALIAANATSALQQLREELQIGSAVRRNTSSGTTRAIGGVRRRCRMIGISSRRKKVQASERRETVGMGS